MAEWPANADTDWNTKMLAYLAVQHNTDGTHNIFEEVTGTTAASGTSTSVSYPSGFDKDNTHVLSYKIEKTNNVWDAQFIPSDAAVGMYVNLGSSMTINFPDNANYQDASYKLLLWKGA